MQARNVGIRIYLFPLLTGYNDFYPMKRINTPQRMYLLVYVLSIIKVWIFILDLIYVQSLPWNDLNFFTTNSTPFTTNSTQFTTNSTPFTTNSTPFTSPQMTRHSPQMTHHPPQITQHWEVGNLNRLFGSPVETRKYFFNIF